LIAKKWLDKRPLRDFGFRFKRAWWRDFGVGLLIGAISIGLIFAFSLASGWVKITGTFQPTSYGSSLWVGLLAYGVVFIFVGIYEEMLFRGYILRNLAEGLRGKFLNPKAALLAAYIISSVMFGLWHFSNPNSSLTSTVVLMVGGLDLGLAFILTGELALSIGIHMTYDFFLGNVFGFPDSVFKQLPSIITIQQGPASLRGSITRWEVALVEVAAVVFSCVLIALWVRKTRGSIKLEERLAVYTAPVKPVKQDLDTTLIIPA
jgi:membrane protease YdiL (CAAX protease family)